VTRMESNRKQQNRADFVRAVLALCVLALLSALGGGGPSTIASLAAHLAEGAHVLAPTHPGWNGTPRPEWLDRIDQLARTYLHLLETRGLSDVTVIGSSIGGWIAAEMAALDTTGRIGGLVLIDATGIWVDDAPIPDFFALDARTGELLWKTNLGGTVASGPITFAVDGRQYVAVAGEGALYVFGLPE